MDASLIMSFITLSMLEIVLGVDNLIFIALVAEGLPQEQRNKARIIGLSLALAMRVGMLAGASWIIQLTEPLFTVMEHSVSIRDLLLLAGGLFLIAKSTMEMHRDIAMLEEHNDEPKAALSLRSAIMQIVIVDLVFSFDSVITAVGMVDNLSVMIAAVVVSMGVMVVASSRIAQFLRDHPTFKMLALSFILMIGMVLIAESFHVHIPKAYVYFAVAFSTGVEALNAIAKKNRKNKG